MFAKDLQWYLGFSTGTFTYDCYCSRKDVLCISAWDFLLSFYIVTPVGGDKSLSLS